MFSIYYLIECIPWNYWSNITISTLDILWSEISKIRKYFETLVSLFSGKFYQKPALSYSTTKIPSDFVRLFEKHNKTIDVIFIWNERFQTRRDLVPSYLVKCLHETKIIFHKRKNHLEIKCFLYNYSLWTYNHNVNCFNFMRSTELFIYVTWNLIRGNEMFRKNNRLFLQSSIQSRQKRMLQNTMRFLEKNF